jgi:hypothetical protein
VTPPDWEIKCNRVTLPPRNGVAYPATAGRLGASREIRFRLPASASAPAPEPAPGFLRKAYGAPRAREREREREGERSHFFNRRLASSASAFLGVPRTKADPAAASKSRRQPKRSPSGRGCWRACTGEAVLAWAGPTERNAGVFVSHEGRDAIG